MKTENAFQQTDIPRATRSSQNETFRVEYKFCGYGGSETVFEIEGSYDIPLGMRQGHLHSTIQGNEIIFENTVTNPMKMAVINFLEGEFRRKPRQVAGSSQNPEPQAHTARHDGSPENIAAMLLAVGSLVDEETVEPQLPFPPGTPPAPAPAASGIVSPEVKNQPKSPRSPKANVAALPGDEGEKIAA